MNTKTFLFGGLGLAIFGFLMAAATDRTQYCPLGETCGLTTPASYVLGIILGVVGVIIFAIGAIALAVRMGSSSSNPRSEGSEPGLAPQSDVLNRLERLSELRNSGALSDEEFTAMKAEVLRSSGG